jgi:hypothetical protein
VSTKETKTEMSVTLIDDGDDYKGEKGQLRIKAQSDESVSWISDLQENKTFPIPWKQIFEHLVKTKALPRLVFEFVIKEQIDGRPENVYNTQGQFIMLLRGPGTVDAQFFKTVDFLPDEQRYADSVRMLIKVPEGLPFHQLGFERIRRNPELLTMTEDAIKKGALARQAEYYAMHQKLQERIFDPFTGLLAVFNNYLLDNFNGEICVMPPSWLAELGTWDKPPTDKFVIYMLDKSAKMYGYNVSDLDSDLRQSKVRDLDLFWATAAMARSIMMMGTCCFYTSDRDRVSRTETKIVERFQLSTRTNKNQADCEDQAAEGYTYAKSIRKIPLAGFDRLFQMYEFLLITGVATTPSLGKKGGDDFICHVWTIAVPKTIMRQWQTGNKGQMNALESQVDRNGVLVLEGTNQAFPFYQEESAYIKDIDDLTVLRKRLRAEQEIRMALERDYPALGKLTSEIRRDPSVKPVASNARSVSSFYYALISAYMITNPGEDEGEVLELQFEKNGKIGVKLFDVVRGDPSIRLVNNLKTPGPPRKHRQYLMSCSPQRVHLDVLHVKEKKLRAIIGRESDVPPKGPLVPPKGPLRERDANTEPGSRPRIMGMAQQTREFNGVIQYFFLSDNQLDASIMSDILKVIKDPRVKSWDLYDAQVTANATVNALCLFV